MKKPPPLGRITILAAIALAIAAATLSAWLAASETGRRGLQTTLDDELQVLARSVESEIERFRYLPAVVGRDGRIVAALTGGTGAAAGANRYLAEVRDDTRADELYVMTPDGLTVAASNHDEETSFVGRNYRFRPYFQDALAKGEGRYYAVGVTTRKPGYFLSSAVRQNGSVIGVAVVKVDMAGIEAAWRNSSIFAVLADSDGVVFLTGHAPWKYRPLHALSDTALDDIARTRKYDGVDLATATPIFGDGTGLPADTAIGADAQSHILRSIAIPADGWRLIGARSLAPIQTSALLVAGMAALAGMLACSIGFYLRQRRQLVRAKLNEHDRLERRVEERTAELHREVEDRRRAEEELRATQATLIQTAKLAALGRMSAAIVHEVSQPLSALENTLATAGVLAERGEAGAAGGKMQAAREMARRIQRTVKLLRSFARKEPGAREPVSVERSIAEAVELARHRADQDGVGIVIEPVPALTVMANAVRLEQVVLNLLVNALDAVSGTEDPAIQISAAERDGMVEIRVHDNGPGIPAELRERIAEPFFTTKQTGEGLGLGLSISRAIVGEFGGALTFESEEGQGSTFVVSLPAAAAVREAAE
ncbi:sensor histidine kinase [Nitratireductor mangrovi]|uniref:histidine kinase n=1 Tax=Nitratireductor mangrovi TaxID=2599600 RepID=A0A5B8KYG8_9HYPH|nr:ATP-binding protein [Nitratireductor mangrovi]QDZ00665.1 sensor histidine kinase [Nitratireductor mangrovi]